MTNDDWIKLLALALALAIDRSAIIRVGRLATVNPSKRTGSTPPLPVVHPRRVHPLQVHRAWREHNAATAAPRSSYVSADRHRR